MARSGDGVKAPIKRLQTIMKELGHNHIDVLKMDIEGGEYEVIEDMLASSIKPKQLLVEFHHRWAEIGFQKTRKAIQDLHAAGYKRFYLSPAKEEISFLLEQ
jgi:predicted PolB exonuclease-like 3'-5' exonuclease